MALVAYREQTIQHQMELEWANADLESRIAQRTDELQQSNIELQHKIEEKDQMEAMLLSKLRRWKPWDLWPEALRTTLTIF